MELALDPANEVTLAYEISSFKLSQLIHEFYQKFKNETTHSLLGPTRKVNSKIFLQFLSSSLRNAFKLSRSVAPAHRCYIAMFYWPSLYPKWIVCEGSVKAWSSLHNNHTGLICPLVFCESGAQRAGGYCWTTQLNFFLARLLVIFFQLYNGNSYFKRFWHHMQ